MRLLQALVLLMMTCFASPIPSQERDSDILSKAEATQLFSMSRQQWEDNIRGAVATGMAIRADGRLPGMKYLAPGAPVTTRLDFSRGDAKAAAVHVLIEFEPGKAPPYTDSLVKEMLADTQRQMAPEYNVTGRVERPSAGGLKFYFTHHGQSASLGVRRGQLNHPARRISLLSASAFLNSTLT